MSENYVAYENLANAVIRQAAYDYKVAYKKLMINPNNYVAKDTVNEIRSFFHSGYFSLFTEADPDYILEVIERKLEDDRNNIK